MPTSPKRLIEVDLPIKRISVEKAQATIPSLEDFHRCILPLSFNLAKTTASD